MTIRVSWLCGTASGRSFQRELYKYPLHNGTLPMGKWGTETVSTEGPICCDTLFARREDRLWVLSVTTGQELRDQAQHDFDSVIDGLSFFEGD